MGFGGYSSIDNTHNEYYKRDSVNHMVRYKARKRDLRLLEVRFGLRASKIGFGGIVNSALFCVSMVWAQAVFYLRELRAQAVFCLRELRAS